DAAAIPRSPQLNQLQVLELWLGRRAPLADSRLCRTMAASKAWPRLRALTLLNPNDENQGARKRLVAVADRSAGRKVAVYQRGWPECYPFAADYEYTLPGYLPDGRMAMPTKDDKPDPPTLCVITFDKNGRQTKDVLTVDLPAERSSVPAGKTVSHEKRIQQHLAKSIGFRPGFIRVRDC